jgi:hypothetical protein
VITWLHYQKNGLSIEEKVKAIREIENGKMRNGRRDGENSKLTCQEFGLVNSPIPMIWKNRTKINSAFELNGSRLKRT